MIGTLSTTVAEAQVARTTKSSLQCSKRWLTGAGGRSPQDRSQEMIRPRKSSLFSAT
jgi:hypothetical protein